MDTCFFCKKRLPIPATSRSPLNDSWHYECPRCGIVHVSDTLTVISDPEIEKNRHIISGVLRWRSIRKIKCSLLTSDNFKDLLSDPEIPQTIPQKIDKFIEFMALQSGAFGAPVDLNNDEDYPVTFSAGRFEFDRILSYLQKHKLIETVSLSDPGSTLSMDGWKMYYDLQKKRVDLSQCFVAMNFDPVYDYAFQKIKEAVEHCGFSAYRDLPPKNWTS